MNPTRTFRNERPPPRQNKPHPIPPMNPLLAALCHPLSGMLFSYLFPVALLAFFVEVFVRSTEPRPAMAARRACLRAISAFAALGVLYALGFVVFAYRAKALYGGWPPTYALFDRMRPWPAFFTYGEVVLFLAGVAAGVLAFAAAVPVFAGWRRNAALAVFRALAALSLSAFLALLLPLVLLPEAAINWWID